MKFKYRQCNQLGSLKTRLTQASKIRANYSGNREVKKLNPNGVFRHKRFLDLPKGLDARKVLSMPKDRLLILLNDDRAYLLDKK